MTTNNTKKLLSSISKMLFDSSLFGLYDGSISSKRDHNDIVINKKECFYANVNIDRFCELNIDEKNYNWRLASINANLHLDIYNNFHEAKYIITSMPQYISALSFLVDEIIPKDYYGIQYFGKVKVYVPDDLCNWHKNARSTIVKYFNDSKHNIVVIRGIGFYAYDRDLYKLIKTISVLEDSCRVLLQTNDYMSK